MYRRHVSMTLKDEGPGRKEEWRGRRIKRKREYV